MLQPAQCIVFLGFVLDIWAVASAVGCLIAALPGVKYGGLFYRSLERCKNLALKSARGNFEKTMRLTSQAQQDLG